MSKCYRRFFNAVIIAVLVFAFNIVSFAQGTTTITVSKSSPAVGDSVTVSVSGTESGTITVKYTSSMLNYISCSASSASAEGNSVSFSGKSADIVFKASSAGTASIIVSSSANSGSSTTLSIGGSGSSASTQTTTETTETANNEEETVVKEDDAEVDVETEKDETENTDEPGNGDGNKENDSLGAGYIVLIVFASLIFLLAIIFVVWRLIRRKQNEIPECPDDIQELNLKSGTEEK